MKKITQNFFLLASFLFAFSLFPHLAEASEPVFSGGGTDVGLKSVFDLLPGSGLIQSDNLIEVILGWVRVILTLVGTLAFVAFVWAGFLYITSFANEENAEKAKKILIWTAIGIVVILLAYTFTSALINANFG